jgi:hypothetical protein
MLITTVRKQLTEGLVVSVGIAFFSFSTNENEDLFDASSTGMGAGHQICATGVG